tara:strand:+ start:480 stop:701 length:222 start_codon:yes stop_codon:yes gene_type:complete
MTAREFISKILTRVKDLDSPIVFTYQDTNAIGEEVKFLSYNSLNTAHGHTNLEFLKVNTSGEPTAVKEIRIQL